MDEIRIKNLEVFANHGVFPEETKLGQKFLVSAVLEADLRQAGRRDDIGQSVDYGEACHAIHDFLREHTYQLIEAAAEHLAEHLLLNFDRLRRVEIELQKPWAPIGLPLETASVHISRGWHTAYIALGSNLGDREAYLREAIAKLGEIPGCRVEAASGMIETEPYGGVEQGPFLNGCLKMGTLLTPEELLDEMHRIEAEAGRERLVHWGPRTLDLDMVFYDSLVTEEEHLRLPHPDLANRAFVLGPLAELCPGKRHPVTGRTVREMLGAVAK